MHPLMSIIARYVGTLDSRFTRQHILQFIHCMLLMCNGFIKHFLCGGPIDFWFINRLLVMICVVIGWMMICGTITTWCVMVIWLVDLRLFGFNVLSFRWITSAAVTVFIFVQISIAGSGSTTTIVIIIVIIPKCKN